MFDDGLSVIKKPYSSVRISEERANNMYPADLESPIIHEISARAVLYMLKSLDETSIGPRRMPYERQLDLECGIMRDCIESLSSRNLFERVTAQYGIDPAMFSRKERASLAHPRDGPLAQMLSHVRSSGYVSMLGDFTLPAADLTLTQLNADAAEIVLSNPLDFGISDSVILKPTTIADRVTHLTTLCGRSDPYTNVYTGVEEGIQDLRLIAVQTLITNYRANETIRALSHANPLRFYLPAPFSVRTSGLSAGSPRPFKIKYDSINRHNTLRTAIVIEKRDFYVVPLDATALQRPDIYLQDMNEMNSVHAEPGEYRRSVFTVGQWLERLPQIMQPATLVCTKNIRFKSLFSTE